MPSRIKGWEWWVILFLTACFDLLQIILDAFAIGLGVNRYGDIVYALIVSFYLLMRGVEADTRTIMLFGGSFIAEEIPLVDVAPFWTFDIWKIRGWDLEKKAAYQASQEEALAKQTQGAQSGRKT